MQNKEIVALKFIYLLVMFAYTNVCGINLAFIDYSTCLRLAFSIIYNIA